MLQRRLPITTTDETLHATELESLNQRIMELALERTGARHGAIFLWDAEAHGLAIDFHIVDGMEVTLPTAILRRRGGQRRGIALLVFEQNTPYLCNDTSQDPHYAPYFLEVGSVVAVPIPWQEQCIGVISVSAFEKQSFSQAHLDELQALAATSAKFLRRAQLAHASEHGQARPFLIKGLSPEWLEVERQLERVSAIDAPVLIQGESGTGKELMANALHFNSPRHDRPLIAVNCAAIPETLLESTLFGHVRGAFTGATMAKIGEFQKADGGTLFLDEVGELPLSLQAKLLRATESGEIQPLGSNDPPSRVDVRLVCATHRDLADLVREGQFRDDLYYRLSVITMDLPPLRRYKDNLEILSRVFLIQAAHKYQKKITRFSDGVLELLRAYDYPGNVRELRNALEHAVVMATGSEIRTEDLPRTLRAVDTEAAADDPEPPGERQLSLREQRERWLAPLEQEYLERLLARTSGNVREAARLAEVNPVTLYRLLKKRGIPLRRTFPGEPA